MPPLQISAFGICPNRFANELMRQTGGACAVGARDRLSMIYFGQSRSESDGRRSTRRRIANTDCNDGDGPRLFLGACPRRSAATLQRELREHYGHRWPKIRDGLERVRRNSRAKHGFAISAGEWHDDIHAAGVSLTLNDGTGPYAFNCGAPAFRFTEDRLRNDIGPRLVAMVRNIEAALGGAAPQSKKQETKKMKAGGKVARVVEGIR